MMKNKEAKHSYLNSVTFQIVGVLLVVLLAVVLLWHSNATSNQAQMAMVAQVYFDGEYRIEDGPWQKIVKGEHISSTEGDVTLRGRRHAVPCGCGASPLRRGSHRSDPHGYLHRKRLGRSDGRRGDQEALSPDKDRYGDIYAGGTIS